MKKIIVAVLFIVILAAVSLCGCSILTGGQATPIPTAIGPMPSVAPTPTQAPVSALPRSISSHDIDLTFSGVHYKIMTYQRTNDGKQFENISMIISNNGNTLAKKVVLKVAMIDDTTMENLLYQEFPVGDLRGGENKLIYLKTDLHEPSYLIKLSIQIEWGTNGEYYNPTVFLDGADSIFTLPV
ncbi:MAG: hypothetical protein WBZ29_15525 [Methanocella sp.]